MYNLSVEVCACQHNDIIEYLVLDCSILDDPHLIICLHCITLQHIDTHRHFLRAQVRPILTMLLTDKDKDVQHFASQSMGTRV